MKAVVATFNQEKALVEAFFVIVQLHRLIVYTALASMDSIKKKMQSLAHETASAQARSRRGLQLSFIESNSNVSRGA